MTEPGEHTLESLRAQGAHRYDPVRFHYLEALAQRHEDQPPAVQKVLMQRLSLATGAYARQVPATNAAPVAAGKLPTSKPVSLAPVSTLAQLNRDLQVRARDEADTVRAGDGASMSDMKSVRQFSEVWSKISAEQQMVQALHRGPENAGPLNSHKLMLRSLSLMRALSPDYLRRFMSQMDSLLWLDHATTKPPSFAAKASRKSRPKH